MQVSVNLSKAAMESLTAAKTGLLTKVSIIPDLDRLTVHPEQTKTPTTVPVVVGV